MNGHDTTRRGLLRGASVLFALCGSAGAVHAASREPTVTEDIIRGLDVRVMTLASGDTLPTRFADRPVVYRPMSGGYRQAIVSLGISAGMREVIERNHRLMDRAGEERTDWSNYEAESLEYIRVLGR